MSDTDKEFLERSARMAERVLKKRNADKALYKACKAALNHEGIYPYGETAEQLKAAIALADETGHFQ
jgi:hypothetical protein